LIGTFISGSFIRTPSRMIKKGSFRDFVFREHRVFTCCTAGILILHFILLKVFYPHTIVIGDGHHYIRVAMNNMEISGWPIGYPKLLEWIHALIKDDWIVGCLQYMLLEGAVLWFYFTVRYLLCPGKWVSLIILGCLILNPYILFISNYVLSDGPFAALTVLWFTLTLWFIYRPKSVYVYLLITLIFLAYTLRYYAMCYPLITVPLILFSRVRWRVKLSGIALGCLLFLGFKWYTENLFERSIGQREFSPLSGWRLASNALIMYRHIPRREADVAPPELEPLHRLVLHDLAVMAPLDSLPDVALQNYFTFQPGSPLCRYCGVYFNDYVTTEEIKRWTSVGRLYRDYGLFLIKKHPWAYARYFIGQGIDWFILSRVDMTNVFPEGGVEILDETKKWFGYKSDWLPCSSGKLYSITYFPTVVAIFNLLLILSIAGYFFCGCHKTAGVLVNRAVILVAVNWMINFLFIIFSSPALLRYSLSTMIVNIVFVPVLLERIIVLSFFVPVSCQKRVLQ
jgi:hypothetical protein